MFALMIVMISFASFMVYCGIGGLFGYWFCSWRQRTCEKCLNPKENCSYDHPAAAGFAGMFWPITMGPCIALYPLINHTSKPDKAVAQRHEDLAWAQHLRAIEEENLRIEQALDARLKLAQKKGKKP